MRHRVKKNKKFTRKDGPHRKAMIRNLLTSLFLHKALQTTEKRARTIVPFVDKLINKVNTTEAQMNAIRYASQYLFTEESSKELFRVAEGCKDKTSGFTRITPVKLRDGDASKIVKIELI